ncbi:MAG: glycoside hydrolase family 71/99-like protein [Planctomycetota bacterium]|jgi:hypothetical protein
MPGKVDPEPDAAETLPNLGPHKVLSLAESLAPYAGPVVRGVDASTIRGKVMCGYQGWFMAKGDGYKPGFVHWGGVDRTPPRCTVDLWPDMAELDEDERFATNYRHADGSTAYVFSSTVKKTVVRHFKWMRDYGIDGAFVQRFTSCVSNQRDWNYQRSCAVLSHCREGANRYGRAFAVMYDTGFDRKAVDAMKNDWTRLVKEMRVLEPPAYIKHRGGPVVSLWGYGFGHRKFDAAAAKEFFEFLKAPANGGCTIMLGVPNDWASWTDDRMRLLEKYATVISPWNVGRYGDPEGARRHFEKRWPGDIALCKRLGLDYYAVAFPGFSWTNLQKGQSQLNQIPRLSGRFLWSQIEEVRRYGMDMVYIAMFDEVDEGTAVFKCTNRPPVGRFATYEGLPSDFYLRAVGAAGRYLRGDDASLPDDEPDPGQMKYRPASALEYNRGANPFSADAAARWKRLYEGILVAVNPEPHSTWVTDMSNTRAFDIKELTWEDVARDGLSPERHPVLVIGTGSERMNEGDVAPERIVEALKGYVSGGGVAVVLSGGKFPLFYPGGGRHARDLGLNLGGNNTSEKCAVEFDPAFPAGRGRMTVKPGDWRPARASNYAGKPFRYKALARVVSPGGDHCGDAVALIEPEGAKGAIVYVAHIMRGCSDRERLLDAILAYARGRLRR